MFTKRDSILSIFGMVFCFSVSAEVQLISIEPAAPSTLSRVTLNFDELCAHRSDIRIIQVNIESKQIDIAYLESGFLCPSTDPIDVGILPRSGTWGLALYHTLSKTNPFDPAQQTFSGEIDVSESNPNLFHEVPGEGSIQSGVGIIRGWACDATKVEISIDSGERIPVAYGTSREDTVDICGDSNNGYGMVFAWGLLGEGMHRLQVFLDGHSLIAIVDVEFAVTGIGDPFAKGLTGTYELTDFPAIGESVTVQWSEPDQNFIIIDHGTE